MVSRYLRNIFLKIIDAGYNLSTIECAFKESVGMHLNFQCLFVNTVHKWPKLIYFMTFPL